MVSMSLCSLWCVGELHFWAQHSVGELHMGPTLGTESCHHLPLVDWWNHDHSHPIIYLHTVVSLCISTWFHAVARILVVMPTEERRLVEEEGTSSKKTWLQKKEDLAMLGELLSWAPVLLLPMLVSSSSGPNIGHCDLVWSRWVALESIFTESLHTCGRAWLSNYRISDPIIAE